VEQEFQDVGRRDAPQGTQAIDRAAQLLTLVLDSEQPVGVGELAQAAELPKSTASRLVSSLERHGLVHRIGARGKVAPGPAILRFAHRGVIERNLVDLAQESLEALSALTGETVNLAVPGARGVEHLAQADGAHFLGTGQWLGRTVPYRASGAGKVFLAYGLAEPEAGADSGGGAALVRELERARGDGYATTVDELEPGLTAIAAPVHGPTGDVVAALAISGPTLRLPARRLAELRVVLIKEARALSARLGHREEGDQAA
jgi:IclR family transcriptional regulator, acetate operon repressor